MSFAVSLAGSLVQFWVSQELLAQNSLHMVVYHLVSTVHCTDAMCFLLSCIFFSPALFVTRYGILHYPWCVRLLPPPPPTVNVCYIFQRSSLSINALHAGVYIYIRQLSSFRVPTLWFIDLTVAISHIQYTFLSLCQC